MEAAALTGALKQACAALEQSQANLYARPEASHTDALARAAEALNSVVALVQQRGRLSPSEKESVAQELRRWRGALENVRALHDHAAALTELRLARLLESLGLAPGYGPQAACYEAVGQALGAKVSLEG